MIHISEGDVGGAHDAEARSQRVKRREEERKARLKWQLEGGRTFSLSEFVNETR